jgi:hypothetical protein
MLMEAVLEGGIQAFGWMLLKIATLGRYTCRGESDWFFQGAVGFAGVVAAGWIAYRLVV